MYCKADDTVTPECVTLGLGAHPVTSDWEVEVLRVLRNQTKEGFSYDNSEITWQQQQDWWAAMQGRVKAWLYMLDGPGAAVTVIGFGVLRQTDDGRWWATVGVPSMYAGKGYGGALTADMVRRVPHPVWGAARLDNVPARRLHRPLDWYVLQPDERLAHYQTRPHVYAQAQREANVQDAEYVGWNAVGAS